MSKEPNIKIAPASGRLGVLIPGMGAVSTTFIAGVEAVKRGLGQPVGSLTQLGTMRLGKRTDNRAPPIKDFVPLAPLECLSFRDVGYLRGQRLRGCRPRQGTGRSAARAVKEPLAAIRPMPAVFDHEYVRRIDGPNEKTEQDQKGTRGSADAGYPRLQGEERLQPAGDDLVRLDRSASIKPAAVHQSLEAFEEGLAENDPDIAPSQIYAYAALKLRRAVRQRRPKPDHRYSGAARPGA